MAEHTKRCTKCGCDLPLTEFTRDSQKKDGLRSSCRACGAKRKTCSHCGGEYVGGMDRGRNICQSCSTHVAECTTCHQVKPLDQFHKDTQKRNGHNPVCKECKAHPKQAATKPCPVCGKHFEYLKQQKDHCSAACALAALGDGTCVICGKSFKYRAYRQTTCGSACRRETLRISSDKRRVAKSATQSEPLVHVNVFERDGWVCHLCGKSVKPSLKWPHPMSASIDHLIPLSLGGSHTYNNVRCAHLHCNKVKHTRAMGEQLLLVG